MEICWDAIPQLGFVVRWFDMDSERIPVLNLVAALMLFVVQVLLTGVYVECPILNVSLVLFDSFCLSLIHI